MIKLKTKKTKPVTVEVDGFSFETIDGSQSTDCILYLLSEGEIVKEYDVRGMEEAVEILQELLGKHPTGCRCDQCEEERV